MEQLFVGCVNHRWCHLCVCLCAFLGSGLASSCDTCDREIISNAVAVDDSYLSCRRSSRGRERFLGVSLLQHSKVLVRNKVQVQATKDATATALADRRDVDSMVATRGSEAVSRSISHGIPKDESGDRNQTNETARRREKVAGVKDETDARIAKAALDDKDGSPLDGENMTIKEEVTRAVDDAISVGVHHNEIDIGSQTGTTAEEVKKNVRSAVNDTVDKVVRENNKTAGDSVANSSTPVGNRSRSVGDNGSRQSVNSTDSLNETAVRDLADAIGSKISDAIDDKTKEAAQENRLPTEEEMTEAAEEEIDRIFGILRNAKRHKSGLERLYSIEEFFRSEGFFLWSLLIVTVGISLFVHSALYTWPSERASHGLALLIWFAIAAVYVGLVFAKSGTSQAIMWINGYCLELVFAMENVFVIHVIVKAFDMSRKTTQTILFVVLASQVVFQFICYIGLAAQVKSWNILPYVVGPWLVYCGVVAACEDDTKTHDVMNSWFVTTLQSFLGARLCRQSSSNNVLVTSKNGHCVLTMAGLCCICVVIADFALEIDVTVAKIETLPNPYVCFSSSVVATFALPELFFVARDFFRKYFALKYGVSFVLIFFGAQMLLHDLFALSVLTELIVILVVLVSSVAVSAAFNLGAGYSAPDMSPGRKSRLEGDDDS
eukprot:TRINITY_DN18430_c0_g2_i1.p1 TRINITY_DN18430_c0_g2~~TRINITY_DN18430_c0_g2_i1.p1  ORF type:complete len:662 (-),score=94.56 TRINITY_DN18430_c0_g2_i1:95-2080(-)